MLQHGGAKIVTDGLKMCLDAGNHKSMARRSLLTWDTWTVGGGTVTGYPINGAVGENNRAAGTDPWGNSNILWNATTAGLNDADGGWVTDHVSVDHSKTYRFSVWIKRTSTAVTGSYYFGCTGTPAGVYNAASGGTIESNPYFHYGATSDITKDVWFLFVGHIFRSDYVGVATRHPESGWYVNGVRGGSLVGNIADGRWPTNTTLAQHRTFLYYTTDAACALSFFQPRIDCVDGTEPTITDLLNNASNTLFDLSGNGNHGVLVGAPTFDSTGGGSIFFASSGAMAIDIANTSLVSGRNPWTFECFYKITATTDVAEIFGNYGTATTDRLWIAGRYGIYINTGVYFVGNPLGTGTYHIAVSHATDGATILYKNGISDNSGTLDYSIAQGTYNFRMGADTGAGFGEALDGNIYQTKLYNRVLSPTEIAQNYNAQRGRYGL